MMATNRKSNFCLIEKNHTKYNRVKMLSIVYENRWVLVIIKEMARNTMLNHEN